jgi:RNA polymerase sigma factor (sigma-70 family)
MYRSRVNEGLSRSQLDAARLGFNQYLRRKHFSPQFIANHSDELLATATLEYSRKLAEGVEVDHPTGFLITCAWRRTKSLLEAESRTPRVISTDKSEAITDELTPSPEEAVLDEDRLRKVQEAVEQLSEEERRLLELSYFEGLAVREVARQLAWHPSKAQRCHEGARDRLHELLGVESVDELEIEIGLAAFLSLAADRTAGLHLAPGIEAVAELVQRGTASAWARTQDLARRLSLGGNAEPSATAALGGSAGRAAGVCATAVVACLATGVVGPGIGVDLNRSGGRAAAPARRPAVATAIHPAPLRPRAHEAPSVTAQPEGSSRHQREGAAAASTSAQRRQRAERTASSQFGVESAGGSGEASSVPVAPAPAAESSVPTTSGSSTSSASPTKVANEQFGP